MLKLTTLVEFVLNRPIEILFHPSLISVNQFALVGSMAHPYFLLTQGLGWSNADETV